MPKLVDLAHCRAGDKGNQIARKVNLFILGVFAIGLLVCAFAIVKVLLEDTRKRAAEYRESCRTNETRHRKFSRCCDDACEWASESAVSRPSLGMDDRRRRA